MNSDLNPEAPEFYPNLTSCTQSGLVQLNKTIKLSKNLPTGEAHDHFRTFTDFHVVSSQLSSNVVQQANQIISAELPGVRLRRDDNDSNNERITDANDSILERININIDTATYGTRSSDTVMAGVQPRPGHSNMAHRNSSPVISKVQVGSATLLGAKNITRPQIHFKDKIDNSNKLWVPKISDKPNSIKPLALNILYDDYGEAVGYEHPYKIELDQYRPPSEFILPILPMSFPKPLEDTSYTYVDTPAGLDALVKHLTTVNEMAVDVEHHSYRTYQGITCLIQVTTQRGGDFIIDALALREHIHKLNVVFTDPKKLKVFHGAENDIIWLQRDFGVYVVGMFDTHQAALALRMSGFSLKYLLEVYCLVEANKQFQLADWRMRPLPEELIAYARMDTHYLLYIYRHMQTDLIDLDDNRRRLRNVFERSRQICAATYNKVMITETSHIPLYERSKKSFNAQQMAALKMLFKWRDAQARELDESTTYLLPNHMLLALAETLPREIQGVTAVCQPTPPFVRQNLITIHRILLSCREMPNEAQLYQTPSTIKNVMDIKLKPLTEYKIHDFSHYSDREEKIINLDSAADLLKEDSNNVGPEIDAFLPSNDIKPHTKITSDLNADAKLFFPPYLRYKMYRSMIQQKELRELKEKSAKIKAISKGNEFIKTEVLGKLEQAQAQIENEETIHKPGGSKDTQKKHKLDGNDDTQDTTQQRKRKISADKVEDKASDTTTDTNMIIKEEPAGSSTKKKDTTVRPFVAFKYAEEIRKGNVFSHLKNGNKNHQSLMKYKKNKQ